MGHLQETGTPPGTVHRDSAWMFPGRGKGIYGQLKESSFKRRQYGQPSWHPRDATDPGDGSGGSAGLPKG